MMDDKHTEFDPNSFSNPDQCLVTEIKLNLDVKFEKKILSGWVELAVERKVVGANLFLDTRALVIHDVIETGSMNKLEYVLSDEHKIYGSKLEVKLPEECKGRLTIRIDYETSPKSSALTWLDPIQTAGKKLPYMFSHCEAIHARAMLPCQDTPGVKAPFRAEVTASSDLVVLMSGLRVDEISGSTKKCYKFLQRVPIPSYLIAIAVGALESRKIGPRSHVWSEKEFVDQAAEEFSETEQMICAIEELLGPYVWEVYDVLVLPPCFSYGGMENPCLTFVSSTVLAGDKSNFDTVVHEISHSWTGNLVTFRNFEHFWLNEGFTTYVERKIQGRLYGEPKRHFLALGHWKELQYEINVKGNDNPLTKLVTNLTEADPYGDAFGLWAYEKGHTLLFYLEEKLGTGCFDKFLRAYIDKYKLQSIDTDVWLSYLYEYFSDKKDILDAVDWDAWLYSPGMPPIQPDYDNSYAEKCISLCKSWTSASDSNLDEFSSNDLKKMESRQIMEFLQLLLDEEPLSIAKIAKMKEIYEFGKTENAEIRFRWIRLGLRSHWEDIISEAVKAITEIGRLKFVGPVYRDLFEWEKTRELALSTYKNNHSIMMYDTALYVGKILGVDSNSKS